jgi:hypothetical protein
MTANAATDTISTGAYQGQRTTTGVKEVRQGFRYESSFSEPYTNSTLRVKADEEPVVESGNNESLVSEVLGVILGVEDDRVQVRLAGKVIANFPTVVFKNPSLVRFGQPVKYQIKKAADGTRYQNFEPDETPMAPSNKDEIFELLDEIELRAE